jgi:hypothetical protein
MNLPQLVRHYTTYHRPRAGQELDWFRSQKSLEAAIEVAALAKDENGKRLSHQRRMKLAVLQEACRILLSAKNAIEQCADFDELLTLIQDVLKGVHGLGELYFYDTALRIGVKMGLLPTKVYLHRGTRTGAKALGFDGNENSIECSVLPGTIQQLQPHEMEDFLCIYESELSEMTSQRGVFQS